MFIDPSANTLRRLRLTDVEVQDEEACHDGFLSLKKFTLRHKRFAGDWSEVMTRELLQRHEAVGVLPYDPKLDVVVLIEQFRVGAMTHMAGKQSPDKDDSPWLLEVVAGLIDTDESPEQVGIREAEEEAGVQIEALEPIHNYYSSPGGSSEYCYLYCGLADLSQAGGIFGLDHEHEDIRVHRLSFKHCKKLLAEGRLINAHALIAMQWFVLNRDRLRRQWLESDP